MDVLSFVLLVIFATIAVCGIVFLLVAARYGPDDYWY
jgi:hypothetical protein